MAESRSSGAYREPFDSRNDRLPPNYYRRSFSDASYASDPNSHAIQPYQEPPTQYPPVTRCSSWNFVSDPEVKRKSRLASYKAISIEGKLKSSVRKSFRWLKDKYFDIIYG